MNSKSKKEWKEKVLDPFSQKKKPRLEKPYSLSGMPIETLYCEEDLVWGQDKLGFPGEFPFTRGIYPNMYQGRLWTMRQFAGFGTPQDTNARFHYLLNHGQTGLSTAFHFPTLMGYDSDSPRARGEVGVCGVAIDTLRDMEILFDGIPLDKVTTSMTINPPAFILLAMYIAVGEKQGVPKEKLGGTIQNDILKEYIAQNSYIFPPEPSMRIVVDTIEYTSEYMPKFHPISISGYHIREAGSTATQELAFTLANGIAYVEACLERGLQVDAFAPKLSFFWDVHNDFFEEIAKLRAARRMWAHIMRDQFGAKDPESMRMKFHCQTAGVSLTAQQPMNNVARVTLQAMAAVLGGTQSLHTNSMDETLALPSDGAVQVALRTQQIIAYESGVSHTVDPLGGSFFVEQLTDKIEKDAYEYISKINKLGGVIKAIHAGYPMKEIAEASFNLQRQIDGKQRIIVGVNDFHSSADQRLEVLKINEDVANIQIENLRQVKVRRDAGQVVKTLEQVKKAATSQENLMPSVIEAVKAYTTLGEIMDTLREIFGEYHDPCIF